MEFSCIMCKPIFLFWIIILIPKSSTEVQLMYLSLTSIFVKQDMTKQNHDPSSFSFEEFAFHCIRHICVLARLVIVEKLLLFICVLFLLLLKGLRAIKLLWHLYYCIKKILWFIPIDFSLSILFHITYLIESGAAQLN